MNSIPFRFEKQLQSSNTTISNHIWLIICFHGERTVICNVGDLIDILNADEGSPAPVLHCENLANSPVFLSAKYQNTEISSNLEIFTFTLKLKKFYVFVCSKFPRYLYYR